MGFRAKVRSILFEQPDVYEVDSIEGGVAVEGDVELGSDLEVDGDIKVNGVENLTDKDGNPLQLGGNVYQHKLSMIVDSSYSTKVVAVFYSSSDEKITKTKLANLKGVFAFCSDENTYAGGGAHMITVEFGESSLLARFLRTDSSGVSFGASTYNYSNVSSVDDVVVEL